MRELKENMGRFVSLLKKGEKITLNYHGHPLAVVSSLKGGAYKSSKEKKLLETLEIKGMISGGSGQLKRWVSPLKIGGKNISDFVVDLRE